jgi:cytochrome c
MKTALMFAASVMMLVSGSAMANLDLAKSKNCMSCHSVDAKILGPSFKDVAKKYAGDKTAEAKLATKVMKGSSGVWGAIPMPANAQVSDAEAKTLVKWVLSVK